MGLEGTSEANMFVIFIAPDATVRIAKQEANLQPTGTYWSLLTLTNVGQVSLTGGLAAIYFSAGAFIDIFYVGPTGSVNNLHWIPAARTLSSKLLARAGNADASTSLTVVSKGPGSMELFWITPQGSVRDVWYAGPASGYDVNAWQAAYDIAPAGSAASPGGITGISKTSATMDVWWVNPRGALIYSHWEWAPSWVKYQLTPEGLAAPGGQLSSIAPTQGMEVWFQSSNGACGSFSRTNQ